jgi:hypothetical protein
MFQVQVPAAPPVATAVAAGATLNPMATAGAPGVGGGYALLDSLQGLAIQQVIDVAELMTGCEMKNQYVAFRTLGTVLSALRLELLRIVGFTADTCHVDMRVTNGMRHHRISMARS